jgi:glycosyltransferase involved in cell wall biosynthesis
MKILVVNYEYPPIGGGGGVASANLAEEWARQGHQIDVLTSHFQNLPTIEQKKNLTIYRIKVWGRKNKEKASMLSLLSFPINSILFGIKLCKKNKYDLINTHFAIPSGPTGYILGKIFKIKNFLYILGADIYDPTRNFHKKYLINKVIKFILNHADKIIAESNNIKEKAEQIYHPNKKIELVLVGFKKPNINLNQITEEPRNNFRLTSIGRLVPRKGYDYLIPALPSNIELIIIGDGPEKNKLEKLTKEQNKNVQFLGNISEEKKWQYLLNSDCYILPSLHEGFGIVCQEAMYAGLPIIATNFGGQTDFLKENTNAILIKPKDINSLRWAIEKMYQDKELRKKLAENNKKDIANYYIEKIAQQYLNLLTNE